ncbi:hypothetical protein FIU86_06530 [Roseovarius sp. THAF9]|nr:hypothetical protein FIU86_06530 [Roseovarius sp. THAF9]
MKRALLVIPPMVAWLVARIHRQKCNDPGATGAVRQTKPQSNHRPKLNRRITTSDAV